MSMTEIVNGEIWSNLDHQLQNIKKQNQRKRALFCTASHFTHKFCCLYQWYGFQMWQKHCLFPQENTFNKIVSASC